MLETLVVGAGPVGLVAAIELARRGRSVRIIEQRNQSIAESRALGINPRTLDIMEASGATERILAEGIRIRRARLVSRGKSLGTIEFSAINHRFPFMTALPQARTEALLAEVLAGLGIQVERGTRFVGNEGSAEAPALRLVGTGGDEVVLAQRVFGCDGARSSVREDAGIGFEGSTDDHRWTLMDVAADWPYPADEARFMLSAAGSLFVLPVTEGVWRFVATSETPEELVPPDVRLGEVLWRSQFRIAHKLAATMQKGATFLAGDAAHIHSPAGARGMNGGIEDAATFAWLTETGQLHRYSAMRLPAARRVLAQVERQTRQAEQAHMGALAFRETVARFVLPWPFVQRFASGFILAQDTASPPWLRK
ncbi:FAD-dependent monooxygenase [Pelagibacterium limicola]|uniref:FAD-dependent monooxygenase n=1 Tax=Pelagibacterium limicola TaxID=2791022 RepID=UPI0018AFF0D7|nr:FAD-dependent monooxygenase [Pelagibacterium limicola]